MKLQNVKGNEIILKNHRREKKISLNTISYTDRKVLSNNLRTCKPQNSTFKELDKLTFILEFYIKRSYLSRMKMRLLISACYMEIWKRMSLPFFTTIKLTGQW